MVNSLEILRVSCNPNLRFFSLPIVHVERSHQPASWDVGCCHKPDLSQTPGLPWNNRGMLSLRDGYGGCKILLPDCAETDIVDNLVILHDTLCRCKYSFMDCTATDMVDNMLIHCTSSAVN